MRFIRNYLLIATATYTLSGCGNGKDTGEGGGDEEVDEEEDVSEGGGDATVKSAQVVECSTELGLLQNQLEEVNANEVELLRKLKAFEEIQSTRDQKGTNFKTMQRLVDLEEEKQRKEEKLKMAEDDINKLKKGLEELEVSLGATATGPKSRRIKIQDEIASIKKRIEAEKERLKQAQVQKAMLEGEATTLKKTIEQQKLSIEAAETDQVNQAHAIEEHKNKESEFIANLEDQISKLFVSAPKPYRPYGLSPDWVNSEIERTAKKHALMSILTKVGGIKASSLVPADMMSSRDFLLNQVELKVTALTHLSNRDSIIVLNEEIKVLRDSLMKLGAGNGEEVIGGENHQDDPLGSLVDGVWHKLEEWRIVDKFISDYQLKSNDEYDRDDIVSDFVRRYRTGDVATMADRIVNAMSESSSKESSPLSPFDQLKLDIGLENSIQAVIAIRQRYTATHSIVVDDPADQNWKSAVRLLSISELKYLDERIRFKMDRKAMQEVHGAALMSRQTLVLSSANGLKVISDEIQGVLAEKYIRELIDGRMQVADIEKIDDDSGNRLFEMIQISIGERKHLPTQLEEQRGQVVDESIMSTGQHEGIMESLVQSIGPFVRGEQDVRQQQGTISDAEREVERLNNIVRAVGKVIEKRRWSMTIATRIQDPVTRKRLELEIHGMIDKERISEPSIVHSGMQGAFPGFVTLSDSIYKLIDDAAIAENRGVYEQLDARIKGFVSEGSSKQELKESLGGLVPSNMRFKSDLWVLSSKVDTAVGQSLLAKLNESIESRKQADLNLEGYTAKDLIFALTRIHWNHQLADDDEAHSLRERLVQEGMKRSSLEEWPKLFSIMKIKNKTDDERQSIGSRVSLFEHKLAAIAGPSIHTILSRLKWLIGESKNLDFPQESPMAFVKFIERLYVKQLVNSLVPSRVSQGIDTESSNTLLVLPKSVDTKLVRKYLTYISANLPDWVLGHVNVDTFMRRLTSALDHQHNLEKRVFNAWQQLTTSEKSKKGQHQVSVINGPETQSGDERGAASTLEQDTVRRRRLPSRRKLDAEFRQQQLIGSM